MKRTHRERSNKKTVQATAEKAPLVNACTVILRVSCDYTNIINDPQKTEKKNSCTQNKNHKHYEYTETFSRDMKRTHRERSNKKTVEATAEKAPLVNACTVNLRVSCDYTNIIYKPQKSEKKNSYTQNKNHEHYEYTETFSRDMKRTHRERSNKKTVEAPAERAPLVNACTVTELKIQRNDNRLSRPEKKHEPLKRPAMLRGRSHEQTSRANTRGPTSFSSNSYNSLGGGDPTRIAAQNTASSSHQAAQKQITTACAPKVRPAMTSNATHARTNRTASNGPMRAPPVAGERGRRMPPTEGPNEIGAQKVATNASNRQHNRDERFSNNRYPGRDNSLSRNTGYPASNKPSNSSLRGTSPSSKRNGSGLKSTTPASVGSVGDAKRYVPKRSSSIGPNLRGNDPHGSQNIKANKQNKSQSQSTGDLNIDEKIGQQRRGQSHRNEEKPWLKKSTRAGQSSLPTIEIYTPEGRYGDKNSRNQANSNILPVNLTEDTARQYDSRKEISHVSADKRTAEMNADVKETARNCDTFPPTRSQNFDGENMKNILYFSEINEPEDKHQRKLKNKSKNLGKSEKEVKYDVVQPDREYLRSRRADSFGGAASRYIFSGGPEEECDDSNQFINDSGDEDYQEKLRENRAHCFERNDMGEMMCDNSWKQSSTKTKVKFVRKGDKSMREMKNNFDEEDQFVALRANRTACLGGDSMRNTMCDDHLKPRKGKKDNFSKVGENLALIREYNDESDEDQLDALRNNRNACLGGNSMRNAMCDDHLKPRKGKKDNFSKVGENIALIRENNGESEEEDQLAALRANRNACLGGDSMRNAMYDDHLKPRKGKKDNFSKVGENVALMREYNDDSDEEDQLAALRANRTACLGGDSVRNAMYDDHLKPRKGKKDNFSKVGENVALIREYHDDSDEEDQLAALRANRNACLGGDSMRHAMYDDHLKPRKGKKDNFSKVGENITLIREYNDDLDEEDQLAALRANRNACLGGDSMRNILYDDHLKVRKGKTDNFSKVGENIPSTKENDDEEDQLAALRANRRACLGGDNIKNVMCDDQLRLRKGKRDNFSKVGENIISIRADNDVSEDEDQLATLRANRAACLGGESMKHVLYDDHLKVRAGRKDNFSKVGENIKLLVTENKEDSDEDQLATLRANRTACLGGSSMKTLMSDDHLKPRKGRKDNFSKVGENIILMTRNNEGKGEKNQETTSRANRTACPGSNNTKSYTHGNNVSNNFNEDTEEVMKSNRTANMSGSQMRNLLSSQNITPPSSRSRNRTPLKKSSRSPSVSGIHNLDTEEAMKTNRAASMGGCDMRNILYGQNPSSLSSRSQDTTQLKKSVRSSSGEIFFLRDTLLIFLLFSFR
ncbi:hypothetical protein WA026_010510 [Henosepilachna vigintioctopunctata]|uniref:Uncharacterized protein n=1 Tax=Henosepilachna vigintioctopunctata TaxID=420089 RepID=A0AAW1VBQ6_9CUCU